MQQTRLSRRWLMKIAVFLVAAGALGLWGLYDATIAYPARGQAYAEYMEFQYLLSMGQAGLPVTPINDPHGALEELRKDHGDLEMRRAQAEAQGETLEMNRASTGLVREQWLEALKILGQLDAEHTVIANPRERFSVLAARWQSRDQPKPLAGFDLPMQWGFVIVGFGLAGCLLLLVVRVGSKKYRFSTDTKQLTFPDGVSITPGDIEDIDKRKWDKFIVQIKSGGKWRKLDLLRYDPLEEWFLAMEKETSFYEPPEDEADTGDGPGPDDEGEDHAEPAAPTDEQRATETA